MPPISPRSSAVGLRRLVLLVGVTVALSAACSKGASTLDAAPSTTVVADPAAGPTSEPGADRSPGCGRTPDAPLLDHERPGDVELTYASDGVDRIYRLAVPPSYDPDLAAPLLLNLHGSGSNAVQASVYGGVPQAATARGMIVAAPEAIDGRWQLGAEGTDREFLMGLVDDLKSRYCVDPDRVHLIGMSLGAWKSAVTACTNPGVFASIALVTVEVHVNDCPPIPVVAFHGTADATVPYGEGSGHDFPDAPNAGLPGARENIARWAEGNGCDPDPVVEQVGEDVERWAFRGCDAGADVELYTIFEGGHTWPGADVEIGPTTQTIDATAIALDWFEAHPRRS